MPGPGAWPTDPGPSAATGWAAPGSAPGPASGPAAGPAPGWGTVPPPEGAWTAASATGQPGPQGQGPAPAPSPGSSWSPGNTGLVLGVILVGLGVWFLIDQYVTIDWDVLWPVAIMVVGGALIAGAIMRSRAD